MGNTGIRGTQIRDETIESQDLASGSIKMGELSTDVIRSQDTIGSVDTSNDFLLIYDADTAALKKVAPTNLGVGGSGSPGGSDTQVQFNDGGSFAGNSGLTFNKTSGILSVDKGAVFNEGSHDSDFRVESNTNANMLVVNAGTDRIGIGTDAPLTTLHVSGAGSTDACITIQGGHDAGIRLAADKANGDEGNNPYIDWYQDGQNPTSRNNRVALIAMEGDAGTAFTGSLANSLFIDTFCPNSQNSNVRRFQIATDCSSSADGANHSARLTIEGSHGYVGLHTNAATSPLHVYSNESGNFAALIDNDQSSAGHVMKLTTDGTGNGSYVLDMESASSTIFRARADGRFGFGPDGVDSMGAGTFVVGIDNSSHTSDIAISQRLQHLGDSDTYMDFPSNDNITFSAGGSEELKIASDAILVKQYIKHVGDENTWINFSDNRIRLNAGGNNFVDCQDNPSAPHKVRINNGGNNIDFVIKDNSGDVYFTADASTSRVGIGTDTPDGILHIDGGTSNTELIIEKDGNTTASIVFDVAGSRRFEISHDTNEYLNFNSYSPNQDIFFNHTSDNGGTVRMLHIDGNDDGAVVVGNSVSNDPYSGATFIVTGTMGHGLGTAFFVTQSASVVPGLHLHNARSTAETGIALRFSNHSVNAAATNGYYGQISLENTAASPGFQDPDMVFKIQDNDSFGAQNMVEAMRIQHGAAVKIAKHFGRTPSTALSLGSGTSSSVTPTESVMIINASSITAAANNMHVMTIANGTFSGQTVTFIFDNDFLDGDGGASDMGAIVTGGTFLGSHVLSIIGSAMSGKSAAGASFTIVWTGSAWAVTSQNGLTSYP